MFRLEKQFRCEAAHTLHGHDGKCARRHGHSFVITIAIEGEELERSGPKKGMLVDYGDIKSAVQPVVDEYLDHHDLNDTLEMTAPTSEEIAKWLFRKLSPRLPKLAEIIVEETCTSRCVYRPIEMISLD